MSFIEFLSSIDLWLLHFFNVDLASPELDQFWLAVTHLERQWWFVTIVLPLLLLLLIYIYRLGMFKPLLVLGFTVAISDMLSYRVVKHLVDRPRPFEDSTIKWLRHVGDAHGPSFPSNHAANSFAGAVVLAWFFPKLRAPLYILALLIGFSRIALGVHYPSDVAAGALLGLFVGMLIKYRVLCRYEWFHLKNRVSAKDRDSYHWSKRSSRIERD